MEKLKVLVSVFLTLWKFEGMMMMECLTTWTGFTTLVRSNLLMIGFMMVMFRLWDAGALFYELTMQNLTFHNTEQTWKNAANFCSSKGGVLESNVTLLLEQNEYKYAKNGLWLGKFRTLTNWTYIRGCYLINGNFQHFKVEYSNTAELQCQMLCDEYKFYSIKGPNCYCIEDINSFVRSKNCSCVGCYKVLEHRLPDFATTDINENCIAALQCVRGKIHRSYKECETRYYVTCDNDVELGYDYGTYQEAAEECERQGSFIKWYTDNVCLSIQFPAYWTSGTRHDEIFVLRKAYFTEILQPDSCFVLNDRWKEKENYCNTERPFFCRFGTDEDKGDLISIPNLSIVPQNNAESDNWGSIAAGTITSTIVLIMAILVFFLLRRRLSKKKPTIHKSQNSCPVQDLDELHTNNENFQTAVDHEIDCGNNSPPYEILNRYPAVNSSSYDCLNVTCTPESENVYINTNNFATSMSDITGTDSKFHEQNERVKQKKQNASKVEFNIDNESSEAAAYHAIDNANLSPQYEKLNNVPAVNATTYDCLNLKPLPE